jgi:predicted flap endonuclease-1-like 5' DNA nuclease
VILPAGAQAGRDKGKRMSYPIIDIEGIGAVFADKLKSAGITTTDALLEKAKSPKGRKELAAATGIDESRILKWANMADLMRIKGVGEEYSELLEAAGVDTVKELKTRVPANLTKALADVNAQKKLVRALPTASMVEKWVAQAKDLPSVLTY